MDGEVEIVSPATRLDHSVKDVELLGFVPAQVSDLEEFSISAEVVGGELFGTLPVSLPFWGGVSGGDWGGVGGVGFFSVSHRVLETCQTGGVDRRFGKPGARLPLGVGIFPGR